MTAKEAQDFLRKYNLKLVQDDTHNWWPLPISKQHIRLGMMMHYYNTETPEEEFKIQFNCNGSSMELYKFNSCCEYFETTGQKTYKELLEQKRLKNSQDDFE